MTLKHYNVSIENKFVVAFDIQEKCELNMFLQKQGPP